MRVEDDAVVEFPPQLRDLTDRDLLLLTASEVGHMKSHLESLNEKVGVQNGRLSALEKWRWWLVGAGAVLVPLSPLLIYFGRFAD